MSAIAEFIRLDNSKIEQLKEAAVVKKGWLGKKTDNFHTFLEANSKKTHQFNGYGYYYAVLLVYLQENKGIDLMQNEYSQLSDFLVEKRGNSILVFTHEQQKLHGNRLGPENFSEQELLEFNIEFSEDDDPEAGKELLEAVNVLHSNLKEVKDNEILLLSVG